tara:strand:+ start:4829 stop:5947 length:1119 start_codon:yes stop_codon:yes gene_type:complete
MEIKIDQTTLGGKSLMIATPMYGGQCHGMYAKSCIDLAMLLGMNNVPHRYYYIFNESLITRARNYLVDEFLRAEDNNGKPLEYLLFIDADIHFDPRDAMAMLALAGPGKDDKRIVGAPYTKKTIAWEQVHAATKMGVVDDNQGNPDILKRFTGDFVFNPSTEEGNEIKLSEPVPVMEAGTGFLLIHRSVFDEFKETWPKFQYRPDHNRSEHFDGSRMIHAYFDTIIDNQEWLPENATNNTDRYLSEDYLFCQMARKIGIKIWFCPWIQLRHIGSYIFEGHMGAIAEIQGRQMYLKKHGKLPTNQPDPSGKAQFPGAPAAVTPVKADEVKDEELFSLTPTPQWKKDQMKADMEKAATENKGAPPPPPKKKGKK